MLDENKYKAVWESFEKTGPRPTRVRKLITHWEWTDFRKEINECEYNFMWEIVSSLYQGDVYIIKNAFDPQFMRRVVHDTFEWFKTRPSEFHKMLEGTPDFHRLIDLEAGKAYSFNVCKHSAFFYPWNSDPLDLFFTVNKRWRIIKTLMGLEATEYEKNTPKMGVVDRIQIAQYPSRIGYLEPHSDPYLHQRLFFSGYLSQQGKDFEGGGFYLLGEANKVVNAESTIRVGDIGIGYATIYHGVAPCNKDKAPFWDSIEGRWFLSMYSNASDETPDRHTGHAVKLNIEGVTP